MTPFLVKLNQYRTQTRKIEHMVYADNEEEAKSKIQQKTGAVASCKSTWEDVAGSELNEITTIRPFKHFRNK